MQHMQTKILSALRSRYFFVGVMVLFVLQASWIALSAAYPMVFDENTHFGTIQIHAQQWSPLITDQPPNSEFAGPLVNNPSFLYQWLLSFPYRVLANLTDSQMIQIIALRFINIAFFAAGLILFRLALLRTKVSPAIIHASLLFFVLLPVVPMLAGQINYDNLLLPIAGLSFLLAIRISEELDKKRLPVALIAALLTVCMFGTNVQYAFLPVFAGLGLWLAWSLVRAWRKGDLLIPKLAKKSWKTATWGRKLAFALPLLLATIFFAHSYGHNVIVYQNLTPQCHQVESREFCAGYGPWQRNQEVLAQDLTANPNPVVFAAGWTYRMFVAMFFTSSGGASPQAMYLSINPLPIIFATALVVFAVGSFLILRYRHKVFAGYNHIGMLMFVAFLYVLSLWLRNYLDYQRLGEKIAIQGRYVFPIILPCMVVFALAFRKYFGHRAHLKMALMSAVFVLFLQGGGALHYITSSNSSWYWQNSVVVKANQTAQQVIRPLMILKTPVSAVGSSIN